MDIYAFVAQKGGVGKTTLAGHLAVEAALDNIFIERLWRALKYKAVYLRELADGVEARRVIGEWIDCYNTERPHSALGGKTPAAAYRRRPVCGYDGPAATRLAHLPTGAPTPARRSIQRDSGSRNDNRNTP